MNDYESRLNEAAMDYLALFEQGGLPNLDDFVASADPDLRGELKAYIEAVLLVELPMTPIELTPAEHTLLTSIQPWQTDQFKKLMNQTFTATLHEQRQQLGLSVGKVAKLLKLPVSVLARLERGAILIDTLPARLISSLANILQQTVPDFERLLVNSQKISGSAPSATHTYLSAQDGTDIENETPITFAEALHLSGASADEIKEWM